MAEKNSEEAWPERLAATVGTEVKRLRERPTLKLSAQALADRTAQLGFEVKRSVITNLENGRRGTVSLADILILARALEVPPIALMAPLSTAADVDVDVEILPSALVDPWAAHEWINGFSADLPVEPWQHSAPDYSPWYASSEVYRLKSYLDELVRELRSTELLALELMEGGQSERSDRETEFAHKALTRISTLLSTFRHYGSPAPRLGILDRLEPPTSPDE